jgi:hypothetical protein
VINPCRVTTCPEGMQCKLLYHGEADCEAIEGKLPLTEKIVATGAGGWSCQFGDSNRGMSGGWLPLFVVLIALFQRRRFFQ